MLEALAATLPVSHILNEDGPYLDRYTLQTYPDGSHLYLHHFRSSDARGELHNHPWGGHSLILAGGYREERRWSVDRVNGIEYEIQTTTHRPGDFVDLMPNTFHRIELLDVEAGCWTLFHTGPYCQSWGFWNRATGVFTPWRENFRARGLL
jgi:hypothetical protein